MCLIDSGASHNFISSSFVSSMNLQVRQHKPVSVRLADG